MTPTEANAAAEVQPGETVDARVLRLFSGMKDGSLARTGLTKLDLAGCAIESLPDEIASCASLTFLSLGNNPLATLPETFGELKNLRVLFFLGCEFTEIPAVVGRLPKLYMLSFKANRLTKVAEGAISPSVCWLILSDNAIDTLPESLCKCVGMRKLLLAGNRLKGLPLGMRNLKELELIRLADNALTEIPAWLLTHDKLAWLALAANPVTDPWAVAARQSAAAESAVDSLDALVPLVSWNSLQVPPGAKPLGKGASGEVFASAKGGVENGRAAVKVYTSGGKTSDGRPEDEMAVSILASTGGCDGIVKTLARFVYGRGSSDEAATGDDETQSNRKVAGNGDDQTQSNFKAVHGDDETQSTKADGLVMEFLDPVVWKNLGNPPSFESVTRDTYDASTKRSFHEIVTLARCISDAGAALHAKGLHHGDLYAHNVLWRGTEIGNKMEPPQVPFAKLSDFGAAFFYEPRSEIGRDLERIEVRAFGILIQEALQMWVGFAVEHDGIKMLRMKTVVKYCLGDRNTRPSFAAIVMGLRSSLDEAKSVNRCIHNLCHYIESLNTGNTQRIAEMLDEHVQVFVYGDLFSTGSRATTLSCAADFAFGKKVSIASPRVVNCDAANGTVSIQVSVVATTPPNRRRTTSDVTYTYNTRTMKQIKHEISNVVVAETDGGQ